MLCFNHEPSVGSEEAHLRAVCCEFVAWSNPSTPAHICAGMECWKCHGQQGRGDGPSAPTLTDSKDQPIRPYNFADGGDDSRFKCGATNVDLYRIFMTGVDGTPMLSFADVIQANDAWDLVHYLRTLQTKRHSKENDAVKGTGSRTVAPGN